MTIKADYHLHSSFSSDSDTPMEDMILQGISLGLSTLCFTEHLDIDFPYQDPKDEGLFGLNTDSYLYELIRLASSRIFAGSLLFMPKAMTLTLLLLPPIFVIKKTHTGLLFMKDVQTKKPTGNTFLLF